MKKRMTLLVTLWFLTIGLCETARAQQYHDGDLQWLENFVMANADAFDIGPGKTFPGFSEWHSADRNIGWNNENPKRLVSIFWGQKELSTDLDISGLDKLENVTVYECKIRSVNIGNNLSNLKELSIHTNDLETLDVSGASGLQQIFCNMNRLTTLDVTGLHQLETLECSDNSLTELKVAGVTSLKWLTFNNNNLSSIDLRGLENLEQLECMNNQLTTIDETKEFTRLKQVFCDDNRLTRLDVGKAEKLNYLQCNKNQLEELILPQSSLLRFVSCWRNKLTQLDASAFSGLKTFYCSFNNLTEIKLPAHILENFECNDNHIPFRKLPLPGVATEYERLLPQTIISDEPVIAGQSIDMTDFVIQGQSTTVEFPDGETVVLTVDEKELNIPSGTEGEIILIMTNTAFTNDNSGYTYKIGYSINVSPPPAFNQAEINQLKQFLMQASYNGYNYQLLQIEKAEDIEKALTEGKAKVTWKEVNGKQRVTEITWEKKKLYGNLDLSGFTELTALNCFDNSIFSINLAGVTKLNYLDCSLNEIQNLNLEGAINLKELKCTNTKLESLKLPQTPTLTHINCSSNGLTELDLTGLTNLGSLICNTNKLTTIDLSPVKNLTLLNCAVNQLESLDLFHTGEITLLDCSVNPLTTLDLSPLKKLNAFSCTDTDLKTLDLSVVPTLVNLNCSDCKLTDINLSGLNVLEELYCQGNQLTSLELGNLRQLQSLNCPNNKLRTLDLTGLSELDIVTCGNNLLDSIKLTGAIKLDALYCSDNQLTSIVLPEGKTEMRGLEFHGNQIPFGRYPSFETQPRWYTYHSQNILMTAINGATLDLDEFLVPNHTTEYKYEGEDDEAYQLLTEDGFTITSDKIKNGKIVLIMRNSAYPINEAVISEKPTKLTIQVTGLPGTSNYHTVTLETGGNIHANYKSGELTVADGESLPLLFRSDEPDVTTTDILFLVNGTETVFKDFNGSYDYTYTLPDIRRDHSIVIALRQYTVTLPQVSGITFSPGTGTHALPYGESFTFTLTPDNGRTLEDIRVYANGTLLTPTGSPSTSLSYTLPRVTAHQLITVEGEVGGDPTGNLATSEIGVHISTDNGQLIIDNYSGNLIKAAIYNLQGQVIANRRVVDTARIPLPAGIYIVKAGIITTKVSVR